MKTDDATHLLLHMDEGKGTRVKDASRWGNGGQLRGAAAFLPVADFKVKRPAPPGPPPKAAPPKGPGPKAEPGE